MLLHLHRRQGVWLPPGGHIERDELPHHAALREIEEETGLRLTLHSEAAAQDLAWEMQVGVIPQPAFILVEDINPFHQHIDFTYFAQAEGGQEPAPDSGFRWISVDDMEAANVPPNVSAGARRAVEYFREATR